MQNMTEVPFDMPVKDYRASDELFCRKENCNGVCDYIHFQNFKNIENLRNFQVYGSISRINGVEYSLFGFHPDLYLVTKLVHFLIDQKSLFCNLGFLNEFNNADQYHVFVERYVRNARIISQRKVCIEMLHSFICPGNIEFIDWFKTEKDLIKRTDFVGLKGMNIDESFKKKILPKDTIIDKIALTELYKLIYGVESPTDEELRQICEISNLGMPYDLCFFEGKRPASRYNKNNVIKSHKNFIVEPPAKPSKLPPATPNFVITNRTTDFESEIWLEHEYFKNCDSLDFPRFFHNYEIATILYINNKTSILDSKDVDFFLGLNEWFFTRTHFLSSKPIFKSFLPLSVFQYCLAVLFPKHKVLSVYEVEVIFHKVFNIKVALSDPIYLDFLKNGANGQIALEDGYLHFNFNKIMKYKVKYYEKWLVAYLDSPDREEVELKNKIENMTFWDKRPIKKIPPMPILHNRDNQKELRQILGRYLKA